MTSACPSSSARTAATAASPPSARPASRTRAKGCKQCGFGFLFELLDDYYPAPNAAFFILDQEGRLIGTGRGARELTGLGDLDVIGRPAQEVLNLQFDAGNDHIATALEWGVRVLDKPVVVHAEGDRPEPAKADIFPAYDDDGGLLLVLTPQMTNRTRNLSILALVVVLLGRPRCVIVTKPTKLGLDLKGGIELVYQGRPTPQVPEVTQQALDDAVETIRKRTDALGVSEPEIQRSGRDQISIGLPDVQNAERAIQQVGTTAQLQFYDWEPNVLGERGPDAPFAGTKALYDAIEFASTQEGKAEQADVPAGSDETPGGGRRQEQQHDGRPLLPVRPRPLPIGPDREPLREGDYEPSASCRELLADYDPGRGPPPEYAKDTECKPSSRRSDPAARPSGSRVIKVPEGVVVVEAEPAPNQPARSSASS